eukprot:CAMPEP_0184693386 /NCGR_PEP_ID=MMETSP0313-20130426/1624_1 /TAXON_ID=2792 /ORGANISM="Porphyridium aerugineum, Strain SAG 1380-2" /LENGTH=485 /DNA_ID=CAMNT_0027151455 /DNA_START=64 /DNA_END=1521 /DNA_ORIENTATION=+
MVWIDFLNLLLTLTLLSMEHILRYTTKLIYCIVPNSILHHIELTILLITHWIVPKSYDLEDEEEVMLDLAAVPNTTTSTNRNMNGNGNGNGIHGHGYRKTWKESMRDADTATLILDYGFQVEEHVVHTKDGYILSLFRILPRTTSATSHAFNTPSSRPKYPVLLMHGFLENSEVWICRNRHESLAFMLVEAGYDVWLGNVRGNKYGFKHVTMNPSKSEFWDFSMDEMARFDLPAIISYIIQATNTTKVHYIGFSQGSAIGFAAFSTNVELSSQIAIFIALAPSTRVHGLKLKLINTLIKTDPNLIYWIFGKGIMMRWVIFWRLVLPKAMFVRALDYSTYLLFGWNMSNIADHDKPMLYSHLYSYGSVKTMVHWFQIMAACRFQMYDDQASHTGVSWSRLSTRKILKFSYRGHQPPHYPIHQISIPVALFVGGNDSLPDTKWLLGELANPVYVRIEPTYEHLDFQFAKCAPANVYPKIIDLVKTYS